MHGLFGELVIILTASALVLGAFYRLRLPPTLGYLVTGLLIGPGALGLVVALVPRVWSGLFSEQPAVLAAAGLVALLFALHDAARGTTGLLTAAVAAVVRSGRVNYWTGDETRAFERESEHVHAEQGGFFVGGNFGKNRLVADDQSVFVDPDLRAPHPERF